MISAISFLKIATMIIMFCMILFTGSLPIKSQTFKENKFVLSTATAFSGGLFLSVGLIHILSEAHEHFENLMHNH